MQASLGVTRGVPAPVGSGTFGKHHGDIWVRTFGKLGCLIQKYSKCENYRDMDILETVSFDIGHLEHDWDKDN